MNRYIMFIVLSLAVFILANCATVKTKESATVLSNELTIVDTLAGQNIRMPEYLSKISEVRHKCAYNYSVCYPLNEIYIKTDSLYNNAGRSPAKPIGKGVKFGLISGAIIGTIFVLDAFSHSSSGGEDWRGLSILAAGEMIAITTVAGLAIGTAIYTTNIIKGGKKLSKDEIRVLNDWIKYYNQIVINYR